MGRYGKLTGIDYSALITSPNDPIASSEKRVMILGDDNKLYLNHQLGGYFLNWNLSHEVFEETDYFENIIIIDNAFRTDPPDVIIDQKGLMNKVMERIPALKKSYKREGNQYIKISN